MQSTHCGSQGCCSFIPPYMLKHIANYQDADSETQIGAQQSIGHTVTYHGDRVSQRHTSRPVGSGIIPNFMLKAMAASDQTDQDTRDSAQSTLGQAKKPTKELKVKREIHDANHSSNMSGLPFKLVKSDANPSDETVEKVMWDCWTNLGLVYKFYAEVFGRDSIDDQGMTLIGTVHFGKSFQNAFWNSKQMVFGDGGTFLNNFTRSLDVVGHELTHGVTERTAHLIYETQPGALNESISDCFGSMITQYFRKETAETADWLIGEDCVLPNVKGVALRSMRAPGTAYDDPAIGKDPQPAHMKDFKKLAVNDEEDYGGVHINSGIPNRAFFLAATGLGGYSWEKAGPIWYNALTGGKITPDCTFAQFAKLTSDAAQKLYGDAEAKIVKDAWTSVGVLEEE